MDDQSDFNPGPMDPRPPRPPPPPAGIMCPPPRKVHQYHHLLLPLHLLGHNQDLHRNSFGGTASGPEMDGADLGHSITAAAGGQRRARLQLYDILYTQHVSNNKTIIYLPT